MKQQVNNAYYDTLSEAWYLADDDPIAILREEQKVKNPWVEEKILAHFKGEINLNILDIGCGGGFLTNHLAKRFQSVHGLDASASSLETAKQYDHTKKVKYIEGDALSLPYANESMDVVCAMDFLEHVEHPKKVVQEAARVLRPGGLFFFHTFNRNFLSWLVVIKFMEWFVPNTPKNLHLLRLFIKPSELEFFMRASDLVPLEWRGLGPKINFGFFKSVFARRVTLGFEFKLRESLALGYIGLAKKAPSPKEGQ